MTGSSQIAEIIHVVNLVELGDPVDPVEVHQTTLRILVAEHLGGRLTQLIPEFPIGTPVDFEVEDHLGIVASLAAQNAFDIVIIGESLLGRHVDLEIITSLAEAAETTPILVLGRTTPDFRAGVATGSIRVVDPPQVNTSSILREVRHTLEMHVLDHQQADQSRRLACLTRIFEHMIESVPYAVAVTDMEGIVRCVNEAACRLWGDGRPHVVGSHLVDHPEEGRTEILEIGVQHTPVEVAPVPIEWLGQRYFLTSVRRAC